MLVQQRRIAPLEVVDPIRARAVDHGDAAVERAPKRGVRARQKRGGIAVAGEDGEAVSDHVVEQPFFRPAPHAGLHERLAGRGSAVARHQALFVARHAERDESRAALVDLRLHRNQPGVALPRPFRVGLDHVLGDAHALDDGGARALFALGHVAVEKV